MRMTATRRLTGYGILALATLGLALCIGGMAGAWVVKSRADAIGSALFGAADNALGFVDAKLDLVGQGLEKSRPPVGTLSRIAEQLSSAEPDLPPACQSLLQTVESMRLEFQSATSWLESCGAISIGVQQISAAILASEFAASRPDAAVLAIALDIQGVATAVTDTLAQLQDLRLKLTELRDTGILARDVTRSIANRVADLDAKTANLCDQVERLDGKVAQARVLCAEQERRCKRWTRLAAIIASLIPLWFGLSQIALIAWGWRIAHPLEHPPSAKGGG